MRVVTILKKNELHNADNYKDELDVELNDLLATYSALIINYSSAMSEHSQTPFVVTRGVDTITTVFIYMLYYTRNLEIAMSYSEKAYLFYVEFISQISDAEKLFLRLSSRDAAIYVYSKTICELKNMDKPVSLETMDLVRQFEKQAIIVKTLFLKFSRTHTHELLNLMLQYPLTDATMHVIDALFYKIGDVQLFNEIVQWLIANQSKHYDMEKINELTNLSSFIRLFESNGPLV